MRIALATLLLMLVAPWALADQAAVGASIRRGSYLATIAGCNACHTDGDIRCIPQVPLAGNRIRSRVPNAR